MAPIYTGRLCISALTWIGVLGVITPTTLLAQAPAYFETLTIPPRTVGTCLESAQQTSGRARRRVASHLVMSSRTPSARREMSLVRDSNGTVVGFNEMVHVSTGRLVSVGETVIATIRSDGRIVGYRMHTQIAMTEPVPTSFDSASLRRMRESAKSTSSRTMLDSQGESKVRALVTWLGKRCPEG